MLQGKLLPMLKKKWLSDRVIRDASQKVTRVLFYTFVWCVTKKGTPTKVIQAYSVTEYCNWLIQYKSINLDIEASYCMIQDIMHSNPYRNILESLLLWGGGTWTRSSLMSVWGWFIWSSLKDWRRERDRVMTEYGHLWFFCKSDHDVAMVCSID